MRLQRHAVPLALAVGISVWLAAGSPGHARLAPPLAAQLGGATPAGTGVDEILLERGRCLGSCPAYRIRLRRDGTATYVGLAHAPRHGTFEGRLHPATFERLARLLVEQGFFGMAPRYSNRVTCGSTTTLSARRGAGWYRVASYNRAGPVALWGLALAVDAVAQTIAWRRPGAAARKLPSAGEVLAAVQRQRAQRQLPPLRVRPELAREARLLAGHLAIRPGGVRTISFSPVLEVAHRIEGCGLTGLAPLLRNLPPPLGERGAGPVGVAVRPVPGDDTFCAVILVGPSEMDRLLR